MKGEVIPDGGSKRRVHECDGGVIRKGKEGGRRRTEG